MTTRIGMVNTTSRPTAEQIIDGDTAHVELHLAGVADTILDQIAATLSTQHRHAQLMLLGNPRTTPVKKAEIRAQLREALTIVGAFDVPIHRDQAEALSADLWDASTEPSRCEGYCDGENFATVGPLCGDCDEARSFRNALAGGRL